ncbi:MAG: S9 family peptidase [Rhodospirillaceae bacterium]|nr:S9 family peptidase [Rhodospirillaceae bacterium]
MRVLGVVAMALVMAGGMAGPAAAAQIDPAPYGKLPAIEVMRLSPSGQRYAFVGTINGQRVLAAVQDGKPLFLNGADDIKVRNIRWADEDHLLVVVTKTENLMVDFGTVAELATVLRVNLKDKSIAPIFQGVPRVAPRIFGLFGTAVDGGKAYGYFGGITLTAATGNRAAYVMGSGIVDLYKVDLDTGKTRLDTQGLPAASSDWLISPQGKVAGTGIYDPKTGAWRLHPGNGRNKPLMEKISALNEIDLIGQGRTPGTLLVLDNSGERDEVLEVKADGSKEELFKDSGVSEFLFDPTTGLLIGAKTNDRAGAFFFDPVLDGRWQAMIKTFPGRTLTLLSTSGKLDRILLRSEGGRDSGTFWIVEPATGKTTPVGSSYPAIRPPQVGEAQMVKYKAEDGLDIEAVLTLPPSGPTTNLPVVVMPHGGPIGVRDEVGFDWWAQAFAASGYAVLQPNYRGSSGYTAAFHDAGYGEWGKKMLSDIKDGLAEMAKRGIVDPKRACIVGASYGGYAAMAGITLQQGLYKCAVAVSGISDLKAFVQWRVERYGRANDGFRFYRAALGIEKGNGAALMDEISPIQFAKRADAPILLIHGKDDLVVPIAQSGAMENALQDAGKPVEFVRMEGEDHWLSREATRTTMVRESLAFVLKHNPPN